MKKKTQGKPARGTSTGRPIMVLLDILGQRWTLRILWELREDRLTFRQLRENCDEVSPTLLNQRLRSLREHGFIDHDDDGFGLTTLGQELGGHLNALDHLAKRWAKGTRHQE